MRELAEAIDAVERIDDKMATLNQQRTELVATAAAKFDAARKVGWRPRDLAGSGLAVPKPIALPTPSGNSAGPTNVDSSTDSSDDPDTDRAV